MDKETKLLNIFNEYNKLFKENDLNGKWVMFLSGDDYSNEYGDDDKGDGYDDSDD